MANRPYKPTDFTTISDELGNINVCNGCGKMYNSLDTDHIQHSHYDRCSTSSIDKELEDNGYDDCDATESDIY